MIRKKIKKRKDSPDPNFHAPSENQIVRRLLSVVLVAIRVGLYEMSLRAINNFGHFFLIHYCICYVFNNPATIEYIIVFRPIWQLGRISISKRLFKFATAGLHDLNK